jgi:hypothetical protein
MPTEKELLALCLRWIEESPADAFDKAMLIEAVKAKLEPEPRPWVGLTKEEQDECIDAGDCGGWRGVLSALEAKLKEKNT